MHITVFGYKYFSFDDMSFLSNLLDPLSILVRVIFFYLLLDKMVKFHDSLTVEPHVSLIFFSFFFSIQFSWGFWDFSRSCWPVLMKRIITVAGAHYERLPALWYLALSILMHCWVLHIRMVFHIRDRLCYSSFFPWLIVFLWRYMYFLFGSLLAFLNSFRVRFPLKKRLLSSEYFCW